MTPETTDPTTRRSLTLALTFPVDTSSVARTRSLLLDLERPYQPHPVVVEPRTTDIDCPECGGFGWKFGPDPKCSCAGTGKVLEETRAAPFASATWDVLLKALAYTPLAPNAWRVDVFFEGTVYAVTVARKRRKVVAAHDIPEVANCARDAVERERVGVRL